MNKKFTVSYKDIRIEYEIRIDPYIYLIASFLSPALIITALEMITK